MICTKKRKKKYIVVLGGKIPKKRNIVNLRNIAILYGPFLNLGQYNVKLLHQRNAYVNIILLY